MSVASTSWTTFTTITKNSLSLKECLAFTNTIAVKTAMKRFCQEKALKCLIIE